MVQNEKRFELLQNYLQEMQDIKESPPLKKRELNDACIEYFLSPYCKWIDVFADDGTTIGFILIGETPNCHPDADYYIEEAYIAPEYRRKKYMTHAISQFIRNNEGIYCLFIVDKNKPALYFWEKIFSSLGYVPYTLKEVLGEHPGITQYGYRKVF